jgi:hypothetical protein
MYGRLLPQVKLAAVEPAAKAVQAEIRALQPYTMSWSNVCEHYHPADFHAMAKACSAPEDTVHYLHSMNWVMQVKGASCIDFLVSHDGTLQASKVWDPPITHVVMLEYGWQCTSCLGGTR